MKKLFILCVSLMGVAAAFGQEALWSKGPSKSPQVNPDRSVTFRLAAPERDGRPEAAACRYQEREGVHGCGSGSGNLACSRAF